MKRIRNQHSNLCLDDYNAATAPSTEVRQWTCTGGAYQASSIAQSRTAATEPLFTVHPEE